MFGPPTSASVTALISLLCFAGCSAATSPSAAGAGGSAGANNEGVAGGGNASLGGSQPAGAADPGGGGAVDPAAGGSAGQVAGGSTDQAAGGAAGDGSGENIAGTSSTALQALKEWLALSPEARPELAGESFATVPLTAADAAQAQTLLWEDFAEQVRLTRTAEMGADEDSEKSITLGDVTLRYYQATRGSEPASGRSLFISMHGGGSAPAATNDSQWQNQIALVNSYEPVDAIWVAPRAPTDEWNMWFREHMDAIFERLITNFIAFEGIDPNRVYLNGYSAGGDGAYQIGPRMADSWAGVGMSAGHPNDASPLNLRNTAFAIHVGGDDTAFDRHLKAEEWGLALEALAAADPGGYPHQWQVHEGKPHWMDLADAVSIPFLQSHTRNPIPNKVVWRQQAFKKPRFYWLSTDTATLSDQAEISASYQGNSVELSEVNGVSTLNVRLSDAMLNLDEPVSVTHAGTELFDGKLTRRIEVLHRTLAERGDPALMFSTEVSVELE